MEHLGEWLTQRRADVPETLWQQVDASVTACDARDREALDGFQNVVRAQMTQLGALSCEARGDALALLTADALVTYALECAATQPETLETFAKALMTTVAHA